MHCRLCGNKTDWDTSYGRPKFIVCHPCYKRITNVIKISTDFKYSDITALDVILEMGIIREESKRKKGEK